MERFAAVLAGLGVGKGDRVGLMLPNCPQYIIAFYACQRLGAIAVGNNPLYTSAELEHQLKDAGLAVMIVLDRCTRSSGHVREAAGVREVVATKLTDYMKFPLNVLAPLKFKREAKHEGAVAARSPPTDGSGGGRTLMKATGPVPPVAQVDPATRPGRVHLHGGDHGAVEGRDALAPQPRGERDPGPVAGSPTSSTGRTRSSACLPFFHSFGIVAMNLGISQAGEARAAACGSTSAWR